MKSLKVYIVALEQLWRGFDLPADAKIVRVEQDARNWIHDTVKVYVESVTFQPIFYWAEPEEIRLFGPYDESKWVLIANLAPQNTMAEIFCVSLFQAYEEAVTRYDHGDHPIKIVHCGETLWKPEADESYKQAINRLTDMLIALRDE